MNATLATMVALILVLAGPAAAQTTQPAPGNSAAPRTSQATPQREPTVGQMAARERQRRCGGEWKAAKVSGTTGGLKWPQYWSQCNARLKGNQA